VLRKPDFKSVLTGPWHASAQLLGLLN